jgi:hypothetical protein
MSEPLDAIVDRIDTGALLPRSHSVVRPLAEKLVTLSPLASEVVAAFDHGMGNKTDLLTRLWKEIESLPLDQQGGRRMLVALLQPDHQLDGYEAGYYLLWSKQERLTEAEIRCAFACN